MSWRAYIQARRGALSLDVTLEGGEGVLALVGPNGAGKTTVLRALAGAFPPEAGRVEVEGEVWLDVEEGIDLPPERRKVGYVPQGFGLFPHLSVIDNVALGIRPGAWQRPRAEDRERAAALLRQMGGEHLCGRRPAGLSGGEKQRVALARALVVEPALLLLDEPLSALDATARRDLRGSLAEHLRERRCSAVVVTHDLRDVLALQAEVAVLDEGRVVQVGSAAALGADPRDAFVAELFTPPSASSG